MAKLSVVVIGVLVAVPAITSVLYAQMREQTGLSAQEKVAATHGN